MIAIQACLANRPEIYVQLSIYKPNDYVDFTCWIPLSPAYAILFLKMLSALLNVCLSISHLCLKLEQAMCRTALMVMENLCVSHGKSGYRKGFLCE